VPSQFDFSQCTWIAIDEISQRFHLPIVNVPSAPQPEDTPNKETIDPQKPYPTCTPDPPKTRTHRQIVRVENAGIIACGKATGLYNKHRKYSEGWKPCHLVLSTHNFQHNRSFSQQPKLWIDQHLRCGLDDFDLESSKSVVALRKLLSILHFGLGNDNCIKDDSHHFGTLYYQDIFNCILLLLAHPPCQAHLEFEQVHLADSESRRMYSNIITADWGWDMQDQLPAGATILPVICESDMTRFTNFQSHLHAWPLYRTFSNIRIYIHRTSTRRAGILVGLIPCLPKGAKNTDAACHSAVETVLSPPPNLDITGPGLKCDCAYGFHR